MTKTLGCLVLVSVFGGNGGSSLYEATLSYRMHSELDTLRIRKLCEVRTSWCQFRGNKSRLMALFFSALASHISFNTLNPWILFVPAPFQRSILAIPAPSAICKNDWVLGAAGFPGFRIIRTPRPPPGRCWHHRAQAAGGDVLGEGLTREGLAQHPCWSFQLFLASLSSLGPWGWAVLLCCSQACFLWDAKSYIPQIALGNWERGRRVQGALLDRSTPRRFLLLGFAVRFLFLQTGQDIVIALLVSTHDYRDGHFRVGLNYFWSQQNSQSLYMLIYLLTCQVLKFKSIFIKVKVVPSDYQQHLACSWKINQIRQLFFAGACHFRPWGPSVRDCGHLSRPLGNHSPTELSLISRPSVSRVLWV